MKKQIKTKMLSLALIAGVAATAGALALNHSAKQAAAEENAAVFQMENTVRLRLNGDGLAFSVKMNETKYNEIKNDENKSLYFIVMPSMYLGNVKTDKGYNYAAAIERDNNGVYNYEASHCLYVNASEAIYQSGEEYYALGGVSDVLEANRKLDYVAVACVETKSESGFTYEYAALPEGKEQMPTVSQYTTLSKSVLYSTTDYSAQIAQYYNWFGKGEYALTIATTEDYNALVGKINGGADLADMELRINSGVDKTQATLNEGMALPAKQIKYSTVEFYDDDGKTLLSSADVNDGGSVTPTTPEKAATEEYTYTFEKWVTEKDGDIAASFENITANMSVYAKYTAVKKLLFGITGHYTDWLAPKRIFDTDLTIAQSGLKEGDTITGFVTASNGTNEGDFKPYYKTATTFTVYNHDGTFAIGFDAENLPGSAIVTFMKGTIFNINGVEYTLDQTYVFYSNKYELKDNYSEYKLNGFVAGNSFSSSIPNGERGAGSYYTQVQLTSDGVTSTEWIYLQFDNDPDGDKMFVTVKRNDNDSTCGWKTGDIVYIKKGTVASYWSGVAIAAEDYILTKTSDGWVLEKGTPTP